MSPTIAKNEVRDSGRGILIRIGREAFAIPLAAVDRVLERTRPTPVPLAPEWLAGVIGSRGSLLPVVDARGPLGCGPPPPDAEPRFVVCRCAGGEAALAADFVRGIVRLDAESEIRLGRAGARRPWTTALYSVEGETIPALDAGSLLDWLAARIE